MATMRVDGGLCQGLVQNLRIPTWVPLLSSADGVLGHQKKKTNNKKGEGPHWWWYPSRTDTRLELGHLGLNSYIHEY